MLLLVTLGIAAAVSTGGGVSTGSGDAPPVPDAAMLKYVEQEVGALVCWNMATMDSTQGCPAHHVPSAATWDNAPGAPQTQEELDAVTRGWAASIQAFGGRYATLVAKHMCGFAIWPTEATLRNGTWRYGYHSRLDVVGSFARACASRGIGLGIYYSVNQNEYLNYANGVRNASTLVPGQERVTQAEYNAVVLQQLEELWGRYGALAEIWFDGGYDQPGLVNATRAMLERLQPRVPVFNGCGLVPNAVAWIGTESGHSPYPVWDSADGCGDVGTRGRPEGSAMFLPYEVDLTLQAGDTWFFRAAAGYRPLQEMVGIYHDSVGRGGNMLLNVAPPPNGTLPPQAVRTYEQLGAFVGACYGPANARNATRGTGNEFVVSLGAAGQTVDRWVAKEDLAGGQRILSFTVEAELAGAPARTVSLFNGSAVGRTLVSLLDAPLQGVRVLRLRVLQSRGTPALRLFSAPGPAACLAGAPPGPAPACRVATDTVYTGPVIERTADHPNATACCGRCNELQLRGCAVFNLHANKTCELLSAQTGTRPERGAVSGSY